MAKQTSEIIEVNQYILNHKKEFNQEIGSVLRAVREEKKISVEELANLTLMSPTYINQIEKGINGITLNKFVIICNAIASNPRELLENYLFTKSFNEDLLFQNLQMNKNLSKNVLEFIKNKK